MNTDDFRKKMWKYMETNHPEMKIANKTHGNSPWKYSTVGKREEDFRSPKEWFNHRHVMPEELVADYDCDEGELSENVMKLIRQFKKSDISFSAWRTNGKDRGGAHVHSLFEIPDGADAPLLKKLILKHLVGDLKESGLDSQVLGNHLIRFEGGEYEKLPSWKAGRKTLIYTHGDPFKKNKIPEEVWEEYNDQVLRWKLASLRRGRKIKTGEKTPLSIKFILSKEFKNYKDGGKRAIFVLASYYHKMEDKELLRLLLDFNKYNLRTPLEAHCVKATMNGVRKHKGRFVGERYRRDLLRDVGAYQEVYSESE